MDQRSPDVEETGREVRRGGYVSSQRWHRIGQEHALRRPGRSSSFGGYRGRGAGGWAPSGQPSRSFWRPVNVHSEHQQRAVSQPAAVQQFPATTSTSPHQTPNSDELKLEVQAPPEEFEAAPSTPAQLHIKQQALEHQVPQHPLPMQQQQQQEERKHDIVSSQSKSVKPHTLLSHVKPSEDQSRSLVQHQQAVAPSSIQMPTGLLDSSVPQHLDAPGVQQKQLPQQAMLHQGQGTEELKLDQGQVASPNSTPQSEPVGSYSRMTCDRDGYHTYRRQQRGPMLYKATKKYVVAKLEQAKRRELNAILNKLTAQNSGKLLRKVCKVKIDSVETLYWFVSQIFHRALMESTFCPIYANFCLQMDYSLPSFSGDDKPITFKRLLLAKCQEEFERGEKNDDEAGKTEEEAEIGQTKEEKNPARRHMLGNIRFIGELYKNRFVTEGIIVHVVIKKLVGDLHSSDDEGKIEALCTLMNILGDRIDHSKSKEHMDAYFDVMQKLSTDQKLSWRVRFLLRGLIDLRKNQWQQKREFISFSEDMRFSRVKK